MRTLLIALGLATLSGCASLDGKLNYAEIDDYMQTQPTLSTPRDGLIIVNLNCFSDFDENGTFDETIAYSYQGFLSEGVYAENYFVWDTTRENKEAVEDLDTLLEQDAEGVIFEYFFEEDINGEYVAAMTLNKRTLIQEKKVINNKTKVFKYIDYNKEYYPQNKKPTKVFQDQNEICYVTASW